MNLDQVKEALATRDNTHADEQHSVLGDFAAGFGTHLAAPLVGATQLISGQLFIDRTGDSSAPETRARMAGELAADAVVFMGATAILKRTPALANVAPEAAGAVLGLLQPLKRGEGVEHHFDNALSGAGTMALINHGPKFLAATGLISSAEKSIAGAITSGAVIGVTTEQFNSLLHTGHLASVGDTITGAASFGLTAGAARGIGNILGQKAIDYGVRSKARDAGVLLPSLAATADFFSKTLSASKADSGWHLVLGSGGSKAALTGAGVVLATRAAELKIDTFGGVSGGFVPAALAASGMSSHRLLNIARETDIAKLVTQRPLFQQVVKEHKKLDLLKDGIYDTAPLGDMLNGHMPEGKWPDKLWTMAVGDQHNEVVFTKDGVTEYHPDGQSLLSGKPPQVSEAVRATSAIPGVLASMTLFGRRLYDGALGKFGKCPSDMANKHFGIPEERIIASLPVGAMTTTNQKLYQFAKYLSGNVESGGDELVEHAGIVVRPEVNSFHSLRFSLQPVQREEAILAGYRSALEEFARNHLIDGDRLTQARSAGQSIDALEQFFAPKPPINLFPPYLLRLTGPSSKLPA